MNAESIADACEWTGNPAYLIAALMDAGFLEGEIELSLHDWEEHQPWIYHAPERSAAAKKAVNTRYAKRHEQGVNTESIRSVNGAKNIRTTPYPTPSPTPIPLVDQVSKDVGDLPSPPVVDSVDIVDKSKKPKYTPDDMDLAVLHWKYILSANSSAKAPNLERWAGSYRLIREIDGRHPERMAAILKWIFTNPKCWQGWKTNILSPAKFREKHDELTMKMNQQFVIDPEAEKKAHEQDRANEIAEAALRRMRGETT